MMNYLCIYVVVSDVCLRKKAFSGFIGCLVFKSDLKNIESGL